MLKTSARVNGKNQMEAAPTRKHSGRRRCSFRAAGNGFRCTAASNAFHDACRPMSSMSTGTTPFACLLLLFAWQQAPSAPCGHVEHVPVQSAFVAAAFLLLLQLLLPVVAWQHESVGGTTISLPFSSPSFDDDDDAN